MAKKPFRYFRGELNGYYLYRLCLLPNENVDDVLDEILYHSTMQWKLDDEISEGESAIRNDDIIGIGETAGLFRPRMTVDSSNGSMRFTQSHIVAGEERSERGFWNMPGEYFVFFHVDDLLELETSDNFILCDSDGLTLCVTGGYDEDDIVECATVINRMPLIPHGQLPEGYVRYDTPLLDDSGNVIWDNVLPNPPSGGVPYSEFYGEKFLTLENKFSGVFEITVAVYKALIESMQRIRFNTPSMKELDAITTLIGQGVIKNLELSHDSSGRYDILSYTYDDSSQVEQKETRRLAWEKVVKSKYKNLELYQRV